MANETCCLCLDEINSSSIIFSCNHIFHKNCANQFMRCNLNYNGKCPLCRSNIDKTKIRTKNKLVNMPKYNNDDYVWIFGYFKNYSSFMNYDILHNNMQSGCFWTLYDEEMIEYFESKFETSYNKKENIEFEIGSKIYYIDLSKNYIDDNIFGFIQNIKDNNMTKIRPVMRIKFIDMVKYKFTVGIGNSIFLNDYVFRRNTSEILNIVDQLKIHNDKIEMDDEYELINYNKLKHFKKIKIISLD